MEVSGELRVPNTLSPHRKHCALNG